MSASSKMDLLLSKAKPISNGGSSFGITYFKKGKKTWGEAAVKREDWDDVREKTLQTSKSVKKEGEEVPVPEGLHPMEGTHTGPVYQKLQPASRTHAGEVREDLQPLGRIHAGEVCGELSLMRGTSLWRRGRVWGVGSLSRKERQRQCVMNWPQPPFPVPLSILEGGGREVASEDEPGKKGGMGGRCLKIWIYFSISYSDLVGDKLNFLFFPSSVCFVHDGS